MHFSTTALSLSLSLLISLAAAQTTTFSLQPGSTSTACGAQAVLDACISSTTSIATACPPTDYNCLCQKHTDVLTCFNVCPNDARRAGTLSTQQAYCANASLYSSSTTAAISSAVSSAVTSATVPATTASGVTRTPAGTNSDAPTSTSKSTANPAYKLSIGAILMVCAGFIATL